MKKQRAKSFESLTPLLTSAIRFPTGRVWVPPGENRLGVGPAKASLLASSLPPKTHLTPSPRLLRISHEGSPLAVIHTIHRYESYEDIALRR